MGEFKGIINVFTQEQKDHQNNQKDEYQKKIFKSIDEVRTKYRLTNDEGDTKDLKLSMDMLQS